MKSVLWWFCAVQVTVVLPLSIGCEQSQRVGVEGKVAFVDSTPVDRGLIEFASTEPTSKGGAGAAIVNGRYEIPRAKGLLPGPYVVRVYSPTLVEAKPGAPGPLGLSPPQERVADRFNTRSTLSAKVQGNSKITLDFAVEKSDLTK